MSDQQKKKPTTYGTTYDWQRISTEGQLIGYLEKLGAVVLKPKKNETGFNRERAS
jgi:hypothetical protein